MELTVIKGDYSICTLPDNPKVSLPEGLVFYARTEEETSLVCRSELVPNEAIGLEGGWALFRVVGNLDFSMTGVIAKILSVLSKNQISIFVVSTYLTDYFLVKHENAEKAIEALKDSGYLFR